MDTASAGVATLNTLSENTALSPILSVRCSTLQLQISFYISIMFMYFIIINIYRQIIMIEKHDQKQNPNQVFSYMLDTGDMSVLEISISEII